MFKKFLIFSFIYLVACVLFVQYVVPVQNMQKMANNFNSIPNGNIPFNGKKISEENLSLNQSGEISKEPAFENNILKSGVIEIPKINLVQPFNYFESEKQMDESIWLMSQNTDFKNKLVFGAHRYFYPDPNKSFFFNIDKLENNDEIKIGENIWKVYDKKIVKATDTWVLENKENELILFSCDPYWSGENRIVIFAKKV